MSRNATYGLPSAGRLTRLRKARGGPVLEKFKAWPERRNDEVPQSLLSGKAVRYSLGQWDSVL
jgi:hypothetical protein